MPPSTTPATVRAGTTGHAAAARRLPGGPAAAAALLAVLLAVVVLVVALLLTGGAPAQAPAGLPDAGAGTGWAVPLLRLAQHVAALVLVGVLLTGLLPATRGELPAGHPLAVALAALAWAGASLGAVVVGLSEVLGRPLSSALDLALLRTYTEQVAGARALVLTAVLAGAVVVAAPIVRSLPGRVALLVVALTALLPPLRNGHAATAADHTLAVTAVSVHVVSVVLWVAGVGALAAVGARSRHLRTAAERFSALALLCFVAVAGSAAVAAWTRLPQLSDLWGTGYGALLLTKSAVLLTLGAFGWQHRRSTLPALRAGDGGALARLVAGELVLMATAVALGVALTRTSA